LCCRTCGSAVPEASFRKRRQYWFNCWRCGFVGCGLYTATKFSVVAISESLKDEVGPFRIEVHCIEPGYFATDILSSNNLTVNTNASVPDYAQLNKMVTEQLRNISGNQPGSPIKGVARIIEAVTHTGYAEGKVVPVRVVLGGDAYEQSGKIIARMQKEREEWKEWSCDSRRDDIDQNKTSIALLSPHLCRYDIIIQKTIPFHSEPPPIT